MHEAFMRLEQCLSRGASVPSWSRDKSIRKIAPHGRSRACYIYSTVSSCCNFALFQAGPDINNSERKPYKIAGMRCTCRFVLRTRGETGGPHKTKERHAIRGCMRAKWHLMYMCSSRTFPHHVDLHPMWICTSITVAVRVDLHLM